MPSGPVPFLTRSFYAPYKYGLPFLVLFCASLFLPTASTRIVFYLIAPWLVARLWAMREPVGAFLRTRSFALLSAYLLFFGLSFFWSENRGTEDFLKLLRDIAAILVFTLGLVTALPRIPFNPRWPLYFAGICVVWAMGAAAVYYGFEHHALAKRMEGLGRYENSIHLSFLLSYGLMALLAAAMAIENKFKPAYIVLALALVFFIILSQTRTAFVSLAFCFAALALLGYARYVLAVAIGAVLCVAGLYLCAPDYFDPVIGRLDSYRLDIWREAFAGFRAHPWLGHGITTEPNFYQLDNDWSGWKSTHNALLGHAYTGGVPGFLLYLLILAHMGGVAAIRIWREKKGGAVSFGGLFTFLSACYLLCAGMLNFTHYLVNVHIQWLVFWVPFCLVWYQEYRTGNPVRP